MKKLRLPLKHGGRKSRDGTAACQRRIEIFTIGTHVRFTVAETRYS